MLFHRISLTFNTILTIVFCLLVSCGDVPNPSFTYEVDDFTGRVHFINTTYDATEYYWSFGDGSFSFDKSPYHDFSMADAVVTLTAKNKYGKTATKSINATFKTALTKFVFYTDSASLLPLKIYCSGNNKYLGDINSVCSDAEADWNNPNCLIVPVIDPNYFQFEVRNNSNVAIWQWPNISSNGIYKMKVGRN